MQKNVSLCDLLKNATTQKRPHALSGYNLFFKETLPLIKDEGSTTGENMRKLGTIWKNMEKTEQERYNARAQEGKAQMMKGMLQSKRCTAGTLHSLLFVHQQVGENPAANLPCLKRD